MPPMMPTMEYSTTLAWVLTCPVALSAEPYLNLFEVGNPHTLEYKLFIWASTCLHRIPDTCRDLWWFLGPNTCSSHLKSWYVIWVLVYVSIPNPEMFAGYSEIQDLLKYPKLNLYANAHAVNIMTYENNHAVYMQYHVPTTLHWMSITLIKFDNMTT